MDVLDKCRAYVNVFFLLFFVVFLFGSIHKYRVENQ